MFSPWWSGLSALLPSTTQSKIDVPTEVANYNSYLQFYKDSKDAFIKVVKPLVEKRWV